MPTAPQASGGGGNFFSKEFSGSYLSIVQWGSWRFTLRMLSEKVREISVK